MKKIISLFWVACIALPLFSQTRGIAIPNLEGYLTLKCNFHIHTIFSDGLVWPTVRIDEAYKEGLDAISITEHLESRRYIREIEKLSGVSLKKLSHNLSYEIAEPYAKEKNIILIRGSEITRAMPPGHHNAIFISNSDELVKPDYMDAFRAAKAQNAFIFWNHPGWERQQNEVTLWWVEHTALLEQGLMHGIEVANTHYFPEAHAWCLEKKLTMMGNTDIHLPLQAQYESGRPRIMTLVFARSRTPEAIREALNERRTAVFWNDCIIGEEKYLKELLEKSLEITMTQNDNIVSIAIKNKSGLTFRLKKADHDLRLVYFRNETVIPFTIKPDDTQVITVRLNDGVKGGDVNFCVENFLVRPSEGMIYTIKI